MVAIPFDFHERQAGSLTIWQRPVEDRCYVMAVDTAGGGANGDPSVGLVLDGETRALCAIWKDRDMPSSWGRKMALLGWYYNTALTAVEVFPATSGLATQIEMQRLGYQSIFLRRQQDTVTREPGQRFGWRTDGSTKPLMIAEILEALDEGISLPSEELIRELGAQRFDSARKMYSQGHDDLVTTLGIALLVRKEAWYSKQLVPKKHAPRTDSERVWASLLQPTQGGKSRMAN